MRIPDKSHMTTPLTNPSGSNYFNNKHEDFDQIDSYAIPSEIIPGYSYSASLVSQKWNPCWLICINKLIWH